LLPSRNNPPKGLCKRHYCALLHETDPEASKKKLPEIKAAFWNATETTGVKVGRAVSKVVSGSLVCGKIMSIPRTSRKREASFFVKFDDGCKVTMSNTEVRLHLVL
jgi:hypothetical protein